MRTALLTLLFVVPAPACILAAPPLRVGYGGGATTARREPAPRASTAEPEPGPAGEVRVAVAPLAIDPERSRDLAVGWMWHGELNGPYVEHAWFQLGERNSEDKGWRIGPTFLAEVLRGDELGAGAAIGLLLEVYGHGESSGCGDSGCSATGGELGIGLALRAGTRHEGGETYAYSTISVELRTPAFFALIIR